MLHTEAAYVLQKVESRGASIKSAVLARRYENKKQLYAVVCETLRYKDILQQILINTKLFKRERKTIGTMKLGLVLLYEYLVGKGFHTAPKKLKIAILNHKAAIKADVARQMALRGVTTIKKLLVKRREDEVKIPRYVRVNTIKTTMEDVCQHFISEGYTEYPVAALPYEEYIELLDNLRKKQFLRDPHVDNLLVFASGTDLHDHVLYTEGDIILQDKASCIPAHVLSPSPGSNVIDCCAAPGNKTSHAAALMENAGKIFAFDLDKNRLATMNTNLLKSGVLCVTSTNMNILKVDPDDPEYSEVEYIIVDPSCSGSGIVSRLGGLTDNEQSANTDRLENLASFQTRVLLHALSFPAVKKLVYSTCSIHQEENEGVVFNVLEKVHKQFHLTDILPEISSRGLKKYLNEADKCLRLGPTQDRTNGFFIACFERGESDPPTRECGRSKKSNVVQPGISTGKSEKKVKKRKCNNAGTPNGVTENEKKVKKRKCKDAGTPIGVTENEKKVKKKKHKNTGKPIEVKESDTESVPKKVNFLLSQCTNKKRKKRIRNKHNKPVTM